MLSRKIYQYVYSYAHVLFNLRGIEPKHARLHLQLFFVIENYVTTSFQPEMHNIDVCFCYII